MCEPYTQALQFLWHDISIVNAAKCCPLKLLTEENLKRNFPLYE